MESTVEILEYIFSIAEASRLSMQHLNRMNQDLALGETLGDIVADYQAINDDVTKRLAVLGRKPRESGEFTRLTSYFAAGLRMLFDKSASRIAEVIVNGSALGIIDLARAMRKAKTQNVADEVIAVGERLLKIEESNIARVKAFL